MIKTLKIISLILCLNFSVQAQSYFNKLYTDSIYFGYSNPYAFGSIIETDDGYITAGNTHKNYYIALAIVKFDYNGDTIWHKTYSNDSAGILSPHLVKNSQGFTIASVIIDTVNPNGRNILLTGFDNNGNQLWNKRYYKSLVQEIPYSIQLCKEGGYAIGGLTYNTLGSDNEDFYLIKTDSLGNKQWEKTYGAGGVDVAYSVIEASDGGFLISGYSNSFSTSYDFLIVKADSEGNQQWQKTFGNQYDESAAFVKELSDSTFLIIGGFGTSSGYIGKVAKMDFEGRIIWQKDYSFGSYYTLLWPAVIENADGTIIISGSKRNGQNTSEALLLKIDPFGDVLWTREYFTRPDISQYLYDAKPITDGGFIFCGSARDSTNTQKAWVVKTDCFGCDSLLCFYEDTTCYFYDCTQFSIDAYFTTENDTIDLAFENSITFTNPYGNTTSRHWDFGDGSKAYTDSLKTHTYTQEGTYTVALKVHHAACSDTYSKEVVVLNSTGIDELRVESYKLKVVPNPASNYATIKIAGEIKATAKLLVFDLYGKVVMENLLTGNNAIIDLSDIAPGIYYCALVNGQEILDREKLVVVRF